MSEPSGYSGHPVLGFGLSDHGRHGNSGPADASYWHRFYAFSSNYEPEGDLVSAVKDGVVERLFGHAKNDLVVPSEGVAKTPYFFLPETRSFVFLHERCVHHSAFFIQPEMSRCVEWRRSTECCALDGAERRLDMRILGRQSTLGNLLQDVCKQVESLDPARDGPAMLEQILRAKPEVKQKMDAALAASNSKVGALIRHALGAGVLGTVKEMPSLVNTIVSRINAPSTPPALQCALVGVLAYVVQPRDIVPDDAPGGFGFIDDCALLVAAMLQMIPPAEANSESAEALKRKLASIETVLPESAKAPLSLAVQGIVLLFQSMQLMPPHIAALTVQQVLDDPLRASAPQPPRGWQMPNLAPSGAGHWSGGAYFEGGNVILPGGASLIDGKVFIPS